MLLHVPFAESLDAAFACGDGRGRPDPRSGEISFVSNAGRRGAYFGRDACVHHAVEGNFSREHGTVMLWFRPDWDAYFEDRLGRILWDLRIEHGSVVEDDPSQRWALVYPNPGGDRAASSRRRWRFCVATNRNRYIIGTTDKREDPRTRQAVFGSQQHFKAGHWIHVAVTWTASEAAILIDGREDTRTDLPEGLPDKPLPKTMQIGAISSWINAGACGSISDFKTFGRSLNAAAITEQAGLTASATRRPSLPGQQ